MMSLRIDRTDTRKAYDAAYAAAHAAYLDAAMVRGRAVADAVAHGCDPASAAAATRAIGAAGDAARAVEIAAFAALAEAVEDNLLAIYNSTVAQMTEITHAREQALLSTAELGTLAAAADGLRCNCGDPCDGTCTHAELLALIERLSKLPGGDA